MKLRSLLGALALAFTVIIFIPSQSLAKGSHNKSSHTCKSKHSKHSKHSKKYKGSGDKGSTNQECPVGTIPLKGSKGSYDKGSKGSKDSKGSCDKGSKGSSNKIKCVPIVPAPIPTGIITGTVYEDANNNGLQDKNETGVANISVEVIDSNGDIITIVTDNIGNYSLNNLPQGLATVTVNAATLPPLATLTTGLNPNDVTVIANTTANAGNDGYLIPLPLVGSITGQVRSGRLGVPTVTVKITDIYNNIHTVTTDINGRYTATNIPVGTASVLIVDSSVILSTGTTATYLATLSNGNPTSVTVTENITVDAGSDFYQ